MTTPSDSFSFEAAVERPLSVVFRRKDWGWRSRALAMLALPMLFAGCRHKSLPHAAATTTVPQEPLPAPTPAVGPLTEVLPLPSELAPLASHAAEILAHFDAAAKAQGGVGWPDLPEDLPVRLEDPAQTRLFANPRALILLGPEPGRLDALVMMKLDHPVLRPNEQEPIYRPVLVRHLESIPSIQNPWGRDDLAPREGPAPTRTDAWGIWSVMDAKAPNEVNHAAIMVIPNRPTRLLLPIEDEDSFPVWFYGYQDRLALEVDDVEDDTKILENSQTQPDEEGSFSIQSLADFDRAKDLGSIGTEHLFEVDGRLYAASEQNWILWKKGPPHTPIEEKKP